MEKGRKREKGRGRGRKIIARNYRDMCECLIEKSDANLVRGFDFIWLSYDRRHGIRAFRNLVHVLEITGHFVQSAD